MRWKSDQELGSEDPVLEFELLLQADGCTLAWVECWVINDEHSLAVSQLG